MGMEDKDVSSRLCTNLTDLAKAQRNTNQYGVYKHNFIDTKYTCISAAPNRAKTEVRPKLYHKNFVLPGCWRKTCKTVKLFENVMCAYAPTGERFCINVAKNLLNFPTMAVNDASSHANCQILASLTAATNVHSKGHMDNDAFSAIVTAQMHSVKYEYRQNVVAYFCFPCQGFAVSLRPGDIIMFNPRPA